MRAKDHISFAFLDFKNIPWSMFEETMSTPFYDPFLIKFVEYVCPRMKEPNVWLWIVENRKAEQVYEIMVIIDLSGGYHFGQSPKAIGLRLFISNPLWLQMLDLIIY